MDDLVIEAEGTVTHPPGTIVMTVVIPRELSLKTVRTIKEAVKLTLRYGALVDTVIVDDPHDPANPSHPPLHAHP
jgi:hypothetical protein